MKICTLRTSNAGAGRGLPARAPTATSTQGRLRSPPSSSPSSRPPSFSTPSCPAPPSYAAWVLCSLLHIVPLLFVLSIFCSLDDCQVFSYHPPKAYSVKTRDLDSLQNFNLSTTHLVAPLLFFSIIIPSSWGSDHLPSLARIAQPWEIQKMAFVPLCTCRIRSPCVHVGVGALCTCRSRSPVYL